MDSLFVVVLIMVWDTMPLLNFQLEMDATIATVEIE
jgi:hypothetical protein